MKERTKASLKAILVGCILLLGIPLALCLFWPPEPPPQPKVEVGGQMCEMIWKEDGYTSHGASWGHWVAVCPVCPEKK